MSTWTLADIIQKVRNLTATNSDQLNDAGITKYVNDYYTFTMPFELKEQVNLQPLNFQALPNIDVYSFPGAFLTDQPMAYADGFPLIFYQDRDIFFQDWPQQFGTDNVASGNGITSTFSGNTQAFPVIDGTFIITDGTQVLQDNGSLNNSQQIATGNGATAAYSGTLAVFPLTPGSLSITDGVETFSDNGAGVLTGSAGGTGTIVYATGVYSITFNANVPNGVGIIATWKIVATLGILTGNGTGTINYVTGAFSVTFNSPPASSATIYDKYQAYEPARPQGVLFYNNQFTFRPIPDQVYEITMQGYINQIQLNAGSDMPLFTEWGQLIAYGASIEIFADRGDNASVDRYYPLLKRYENVALARTVQQYEAQQSVPRF